MKWWPFCPKPLAIQTVWKPFCSDFQGFGFGMVCTIAIAMTDHSKTKPLEIQTSKPLVFQCVCYSNALYSSPHYINLLPLCRSQYHFDCDCIPCTAKEFQEFEERFSALKCHSCGGPIKNPSSENSLEHSLPCYDCGKEQVHVVLKCSKNWGGIHQGLSSYYCCELTLTRDVI